MRVDHRNMLNSMANDIDARTEHMTPEQAMEFLEELDAHIQARLDGLCHDVERAESDSPEGNR